MNQAAACHELLLRLAGRVPDTMLWRLRDWLGTGGHASIAAVLPRLLLRRRVGLTEEERALLIASTGAWGAAPRLLDAVLPLPYAERSEVLEPDTDLDPAALSVLGVVRSHPGVAELRQARRDGQRVLVVIGSDAPWVLTGVLQRILRAHGDRTPRVEVLPTDVLPPHHRATVDGSAALWRSPLLSAY